MRYLAWLLAAVCALPAYALTKVDIYSTEVVVDSQQPNGDEIARQQGMVEVLIKASGDSNAAANPVVKKALGSSSRYITQLGYTQLDGQQALRMTFNSEQINTLLKQADISTWPVERSNVMVWLVEDNGRDRSITWEHTDSSASKQLKREATRRGLPVTFPVGDFDDMTGIQPTDLWGGFVSPIAQATKRYPVDAVMVVRAEGTSIRWTLYDQSPETLGRNQLDPITGSAAGSVAMANLIDQVSDYYAAKNATAISGESAGTVTVAFSEMNSADAFFTLERALERLASTAKVEVVEIKGSQITVKVSLLGSIESFEQEVLKSGLVKKIELMPAEVPSIMPEIPAIEPQTPVVVEPGADVSTLSEQPDSQQELTSIQPRSELIVQPQLSFEWL
ncbi:DUF2066 domain-containing protein [Vibrio hangzhouensis]|uniref:DUF2066 domain-containing protein n=1 Tax=Vibrio hangzhouensis TaxID=462991 RepID=A0A1H6BLC3_9VIBR|nr:DUF2066 domain-containing protein [Vibrio hangzhouensis]SEG61519.1 hypothetical protein SAMN04488244_12351 [Vibrio hangzhouensis]